MKNHYGEQLPEVGLFSHQNTTGLQGGQKCLASGFSRFKWH